MTQLEEAPPLRVTVDKVTPPRLMIDGRDVRSLPNMPSGQRPRLPGFCASRTHPRGGVWFGVTSKKKGWLGSNRERLGVHV